jgi:hypothetical protein
MIWDTARVNQCLVQILKIKVQLTVVVEKIMTIFLWYFKYVKPVNIGDKRKANLFIAGDKSNDRRYPLLPHHSPEVTLCGYQGILCYNIVRIMAM